MREWRKEGGEGRERGSVETRHKHRKVGGERIEEG